MALPALTVSGAILAAYSLGRCSGFVDAHGESVGGFFGTAVATVGMLSTTAYVLAMDTFGPIVDNAGGIMEMGGQPEEARAGADLLDAAGNTTKALTKGYAIASAALAAFLLFGAYQRTVRSYGVEAGRDRHLEAVGIPRRLLRRDAGLPFLRRWPSGRSAEARTA